MRIDGPLNDYLGTGSVVERIHVMDNDDVKMIEINGEIMVNPSPGDETDTLYIRPNDGYFVRIYRPVVVGEGDDLKVSKSDGSGQTNPVRPKVAYELEGTHHLRGRDFINYPVVNSNKELRGTEYIFEFVPYTYEITVGIHPDHIGQGTITEPLMPVEGYVEVVTNTAMPLSYEEAEGYDFDGWVVAVDQGSMVSEIEYYPMAESIMSSQLWVDGDIDVYVDGESRVDSMPYNFQRLTLLATFVTEAVEETGGGETEGEKEEPQVDTPSPNKPSVTKYSLTINSTDGGTVQGHEHTRLYERGTRINMTLVAEEGYEFIGWIGDTDILSNDLLAVVTEDATLTANFAEIIVEVEPELEEAPEEVVLDEVVPESAPAVIEDEALPQTGGLPIFVIGAIGTACVAFGTKLRKRL